MAENIDRICLFVASSDNTKDVFKQVSPSLLSHWPDCPFKRYVGLNTLDPTLVAGFEPVLAPQAGWRQELTAQLEQVPHDYVLLFLDDFLLLSQVDTERVAPLLSKAVASELDYLRMVPIQRALIPAALHRFGAAVMPRRLEAIPFGSPYYASLQVALWKRSHLLAMLNQPGNIWDFEHQMRSGVRHHAVSPTSALDYRHVVEKGLWQHHAAALFQQAGLSFDPGHRGLRPPSEQLLMWYSKIKFWALGYSVVRLKRLLRQLSSRRHEEVF